MIKHSTSHGLATLCCSVAAAFFVETTKPTWPKAHKFLDSITMYVHPLCAEYIKPELLKIAVTAAILAVIWGVLFKITFKS